MDDDLVDVLTAMGLVNNEPEPLADSWTLDAGFEDMTGILNDENYFDTKNITRGR